MTYLLDTQDKLIACLKATAKPRGRHFDVKGWPLVLTTYRKLLVRRGYPQEQARSITEQARKLAELELLS